jgi:hypothetical protein
MRIIGFLSGMQLLKGRRQIPTLFGLIHVVIAPLFFSRIMLNISEKPIYIHGKSLTTMYSIALPRNPPPENFGQLLDVFRTSRRVHCLIELNLVAGDTSQTYP